MSDFKGRLETEFSELKSKLNGLSSFLQSEKVKELPQEQQILLVEQFHYMDGYFKALEKRIALLEGVKLEGGETFGMERVKLSFNPSGNPQVNLVKRIQADFIDLAQELKASGSDARYTSIAQTEAETASMYLVKSLF
ncbi:MAG: hypothetical protein LBE34_12545 [Flavobacteriaceae bacterium]|jgi:hypothetical protein|nr:hypothetical protein [Flavobacteriaceae bacterium]